MLAYNGRSQAPRLKAQQGSEIEVNVINDGDLRGDGPLEATAASGEPL